MENDSVRSMGESTLVDVWINGKMRSVCVSRAAIEGFLKPSSQAAAAMSDDDRREFVRTHLAEVVEAAKDRLGGKDSGAESILIEQLGPQPRAGFVERRRGGDRRKGGRRGSDRRS